MNSFGKHFILRLLTGLVFASAFASVVQTLQLFDFWLAPQVSFVFVLLSFLFLSQKYTLFMQVLALVCALYTGYKAQGVTVKEVAQSADFLRARKLFLQVIRYKLEENPVAGPKSPHDNLAYCSSSSCPKHLQNEQDVQFWVYETAHIIADEGIQAHAVECAAENTACQSPQHSFRLVPEGDKSKELWYLDDHLRLLTWDQLQLRPVQVKNLSLNK